MFPGNKQFAFTIVDDTDDATVDNIVPIYEFLSQQKIFITKTVWPSPCPEGSTDFFVGQTLFDATYRDAIKKIKNDGHEIAFHCATMESSHRSRTEDALNIFQSVFGEYPYIHCNHANNLENIYWGDKRFSVPPLRVLFRLMRRTAIDYLGDDRNSMYYWGDLHKKYIKYLRNLTFRNELNITKINRDMPYKVSKRTDANYFFSTADAPDAFAFRRYVTRKKIDKLIEEGGVCILSTHLGKKYFLNNKIDDYFREIMIYLSHKEGWFVPTSTILDHLLLHKKDTNHVIGWLNLFVLEMRFLVDLMMYKNQLKIH